jgi:hypothetical protein
MVSGVAEVRYHAGFSQRHAVRRAREIDEAFMPSPAQSPAA